uniref:VWFD domain-containing protein n=1 Tax=Otus sunia TaxID=257818 RepID=A0A8C8ASN0_9STRI
MHLWLWCPRSSEPSVPSCARSTCQGGRWLCSRDRCPGECTVLGGRHYITFDHRRFSFPGACAYTLVQVRAATTVDSVVAAVVGTCPKGPWCGLWGLNGVSPPRTSWRGSSPVLAWQVRGLCGTYNWNQGDEFTTPAGDVEAGVTAFASSYRVSSHCLALGPFTLEPCGNFAGWREHAEPCHQAVQLEPFWQLCLHEACACRDGQRCLCPVLAAYARRCATEGTELSWRNRSFCDVPCAGGQLYRECGRACGQTCADLRLDGAGSCPDLAGLCIPGCQCPPGLVLAEGGQCVPPSACPCRHGTRLYPPGSQILRSCNACVCRQQRWHCGQEECAGTCVATGDPHYVTFDGRAFSFPGDCEYLLAREATGLFTVTAENVPCGTSGVTCTKSVVVVMGNTVVHMLGSGGSPGWPCHSGDAGVEHPAGATPGTRVYVRLEPQHRGRVAGLCGNFDGDAENDFGSRQGVLEPTAELFGNSWRLSLLCPEVDGTDTQHPCTSPHRAAWARRRCSVLQQRLFAPCHDAVPCQRFYDCCDSGGDCECLCTAIATYAEECSRRGIHIRWRSQELCPLQCDRGLEYSACGPPCPPTCRDLSQGPPKLCQGLACLEGCFCPLGTLLHGEGCCVPPSRCLCHHRGRLYQPGDTDAVDACNNWCERGHRGLPPGEAGCPPGRQFRECLWGGGCPYSCAHLGGWVGCARGGCTEGCHCPPGTYLHRDACLSVSPHWDPVPGDPWVLLTFPWGGGVGAGSCSWMGVLSRGCSWG